MSDLTRNTENQFIGRGNEKHDDNEKSMLSKRIARLNCGGVNFGAHPTRIQQIVDLA